MNEGASGARAGRSQGVLSLGNIRLNLDNFQVIVGSEHILTTFKEFELLKALMGSENRIIRVDILTVLLWAETGRKAVRRLNVLVHRLRAKLARSEPYQLQTVRKRGYGLIPAA